MENFRRMPLAATVALALGLALGLALSLTLAPAALAHGPTHAGGGHAGPEGPLGVLLLPPETVLGGVAFFGVLYAIRRRRG